MLAVRLCRVDGTVRGWTSTTFGSDHGRTHLLDIRRRWASRSAWREYSATVTQPQSARAEHHRMSQHLSQPRCAQGSRLTRLSGREPIGPLIVPATAEDSIDMEVPELPYTVFLDEIHAIFIPFPKALGLSSLCVRPRDKSDADPDSLCGSAIACQFDHGSCDRMDRRCSVSNIANPDSRNCCSTQVRESSLRFGSRSKIDIDSISSRL